jgi:hypothetical protein
LETKPTRSTSIIEQGRSVRLQTPLNVSQSFSKGAEARLSLRSEKLEEPFKTSNNLIETDAQKHLDEIQIQQDTATALAESSPVQPSQALRSSSELIDGMSLAQISFWKGSNWLNVTTCLSSV